MYKDLCIRRLIVTLLIACLAVTTVSAREHSFNWYTEVSYLRWKAVEDQLQYGIFLPQGILASDAQPFIEKFIPINQSFNFDNGVRLAVGSIIDSCYDASIVWTHFKQKSSNPFSDSRSQHIMPSPLTQVVGLIVLFSTKAESCYKLNYDTIELNLSQAYEVSEQTQAQAQLGILIGRINQRQNINFGQVPIAQDLDFLSAYTNRCNNFIGAGPQIAGSVSWHSCNTWSVFAGISGALLAGTCKTNIVNFLSTGQLTPPSCCAKQAPMRDINPCTEIYLDGKQGIIHWFQATNVAAENEPTFNVTINNCKGCVRPHLGLNLGLDWQHSPCNWLDMNASISFEAHFWPEQWQAVSSVFNVVTNMFPGGGNLGLYGATFCFGLNF